MARFKPAASRSERFDLYQHVTDQIVAALDQGVRPWVKPWSAEHLAGRVSRPLRACGKNYRGINASSYGSPPRRRAMARPIGSPSGRPSSWAAMSARASTGPRSAISTGSPAGPSTRTPARPPSSTYPSSRPTRYLVPSSARTCRRISPRLRPCCPRRRQKKPASRMPRLSSPIPGPTSAMVATGPATRSQRIGSACRPSRPSPRGRILQHSPARNLSLDSR